MLYITLRTQALDKRAPNFVCKRHLWQRFRVDSQQPHTVLTCHRLVRGAAQPSSIPLHGNCKLHPALRGFPKQQLTAGAQTAQHSTSRSITATSKHLTLTMQEERFPTAVIMVILYKWWCWIEPGSTQNRSRGSEIPVPHSTPPAAGPALCYSLGLPLVRLLWLCSFWYMATSTRNAQSIPLSPRRRDRNATK